MHKYAKLLPLAGVASLALVGAGAAQSSASATQDACRVTIRSLQALDLQEANKDETFMELGDTTTPSQKYSVNTKRNNIGSDVFIGNELVTVLEDDLVGDDLIDSFTVPCTNDFGTSLASGNNAIYKVKWTVAVLP